MSPLASKKMRFLTYIANLTRVGTKESSKRFTALYIVLIIVTFLVFRYTNTDNYPLVLGELLGFATLLFGIGSFTNENKPNKDA